VPALSKVLRALAATPRGFSTFEYGISAKWLELLKEVSPRMTRAAVLRDATIAAGAGQLGALQSVAPSLGVELRPVAVRDAGEIERTVTAFAREANSGLIVTAGAGVATNRELIIKLAARYRLPAVYPYRYYVASGGLMSYGPDNIEADYPIFWHKADVPVALPNVCFWG
jgi:putative tryptophan/tyrosine transport system substrate-binding protein